MFGYFQSRDKAVMPLDRPWPKTPHCMQTSRLYVLYNQSYCRTVSQCGENGSMTFLLLWPWPLPDVLHIWT